MELYTGAKLGEKFCSPFRKDTRAGCSLVWENGKIVLKDFGVSSDAKECGDIFNIGWCVYPDLPFYELLRQMLEDAQKGGATAQAPAEEKLPTRIQARLVPFTPEDLAWWKFFTAEELEAAHIYRALRVYINGAVFYNFHRDEPCYIYQYGDKLKVYRPLMPDEWKWRSNVPFDAVDGEDKGNGVIITKSRKDCMVLRKATDLSVVAVQAEGVVSLPSLISSRKILLFDNDEAGRKAALRLTRPDVQVAFVPEGKDPFEFASLHGISALQNFILNL